MRVVGRIVLLGSLALGAGSCGDNGLIPGECGKDDLGSQSFAASCEVGAKFDAFLDATVSISNLAEDLATDVKTACDAIVTDLGGTPPAETGTLADDVEASCNAADAAIQAAINTALPVGATLSISVVEGVCEVNITAAATCTASCDVEANIDPGSVECDPGHVYGTCTGVCSGSCTGGCSAGCTGRCSAQCTGTCSGVCNGTCEGTCVTQGAEGQCAGECQGTCTGTCSLDCDGSCTGSCEAGCTGTCEGECHGDCNVDIEAPHCEGTPPSLEADADCQASCNAQATVEATCTPPEVVVVSTVDGGDPELLAALVATLGTNLPALFEAIARTTTDAVDAVDAYVTSAAALADGVLECGATAVACGLTVAETSAEAFGQFSATASVSVNVTVSASASASAE